MALWKRPIRPFLWGLARECFNQRAGLSTRKRESNKQPGSVGSGPGRQAADYQTCPRCLEPGGASGEGGNVDLSTPHVVGLVGTDSITQSATSSILSPRAMVRERRGLSSTCSSSDSPPATGGARPSSHGHRLHEDSYLCAHVIMCVALSPYANLDDLFLLQLPYRDDLFQDPCEHLCL